jgi:transcriptional regulator with XRE-family HTH domain
LCELKGINIEYLGTKLELGAKAIYKWDKSSPKVDTIIKVADYFNVSIDYLIGRSITEDEYIKEKPLDITYRLLSEKAREKGMPVDVLEKLIEFYTQK